MFISKKTIIITLVTVVMLSGCGSEGAFDSLPTPPSIIIELPIANAGADQSVIINNEVTFNASNSTVDANGSIASYSWKEGETELSTASTFSKSDFLLGAHTITLTITDNLGNKSSDELVVTIIWIVRQLNDTGQTWGANYPSGNNLDCSGNDFEAQDCSHGRDAQAAAGTLTKVGSGSAGFDFTKLDSNGSPLLVQDGTWSESGDEGQGTKWSCVKDNHTGFIWEVKTTTGLHNHLDTYTWYNTDTTTNGGAAGVPNNDTACYGYDASDSTTFCNTQAFVARVNIVGLCGNNDWRLPSIGVLSSIADYSIFDPAIDTAYYPNVTRIYWSSSASASSSGNAWFVGFGNGSGYNHVRSDNFGVRLVRGGQ
jgi:hypothetical protein